MVFDGGVRGLSFRLFRESPRLPLCRLRVQVSLPEPIDRSPWRITAPSLVAAFETGGPVAEVLFDDDPRQRRGIVLAHARFSSREHIAARRWNGMMSCAGFLQWEPVMQRHRKAANGEGSIYASKSGWVACVTVRSSDGRQVRKSRRAKSRYLACRVLEDLHEEFPSFGTRPSQITFSQLIERWLCSPDLSGSTARTYRAVSKHIVRAGGSLKVQTLDAMQLDEMSIAIAKSAPAPTQRICVTVLRQVLAYAVRLEVITERRQQTLVAKLKRSRCPRPKIVPFTYEESQQILGAARSHRLYAAFVIAFMLGLRQGEIFGLRWRDVDWEAGTLAINQQVTVLFREVIVKEPKTAAGRRTLPMPQTVREALHERRQAALVEGLASPDDFVFAAMDGGAITRRKHVTIWEGLLKQAGVPCRGLHHARHSCATMLLDQAVALQVVSAILGHSSPAITLSIYAHVIPRATAEAIERVEQKLLPSAENGGRTGQPS